MEKTRADKRRSAESLGWLDSCANVNKITLTSKLCSERLRNFPRVTQLKPQLAIIRHLINVSGWSQVSFKKYKSTASRTIHLLTKQLHFQETAQEIRSRSLKYVHEDIVNISGRNWLQHKMSDSREINCGVSICKRLLQSC